MNWFQSFRAAYSAFRTARSVENPSTPLSAGADWMYDVFGAVKSASGIRVNRKTIFTYSPVWRAVNLIAGDVAKLPIYVSQVDPSGEGKTRDVRHPAYRPLRRKPNSEQTAYEFKQLVQAHALIEGNGYAYILRRGDASPDELIPLLPDRTYPVRYNGVLRYVTTVNGEMRKLKPEDVLHIKGLGYDGLAGYPLYQFARDSIGTGMAAMKFGAKYFANNAEPSFVLEYPGMMGEEEIKNLAASWDRMHGGLERSHKPAILENGVTLKAVGADPKKAQLLELRQYEAKEVANWFGMPVHKLGDTSTTSYASLEQENQAYLDDCLERWLVNWEEQCFEKLLTEEQKREESRSIDFDRMMLDRADLAARGNYYNMAFNSGWMCADEIRHREGMGSIPDGAGKIFRQPLNMAKAGQDPNPDPADTSDSPPAAGSGNEKPPKKGKKKAAARQQALRGLIVDAAGRMVRRVAVQARKAAKRPEKFLDFLDNELRANNRDVMLDVFAPVAGAAAALAPAARVNAAETTEYLLDTLRAELLEVSGRATADGLAAAIDAAIAAAEPKLADELANVLLAA